MAVRLTELLHQVCEIKGWQALKGGTSGRLRTEFPPLEAFLWGTTFGAKVTLQKPSVKKKKPCYGPTSETRAKRARAKRARAVRPPLRRSRRKPDRKLGSQSGNFLHRES